MFMQCNNSCYFILRYKILEELGDGTCGSVFKAIHMETYEIVRSSLLYQLFKLLLDSLYLFIFACH